MTKVRIFLNGVGGQGTLTATSLLAQAAMDKDLHVTAGEIHGMAQRGGVVESTVLIGGFTSPRISHGEADVLLGFEPLETLRALPYLRPGGTVISSNEFIAPLGVATGRQPPPFSSKEQMQEQVRSCAGTCFYLPSQSLGKQAGAAQCGNLALLGAACATDALPLTPQDLINTVKKHLNPRIVDMNIRAIELGIQAIQEPIQSH